MYNEHYFNLVKSSVPAKAMWKTYGLPTLQGD